VKWNSLYFSHIFICEMPKFLVYHLSYSTWLKIVDTVGAKRGTKYINPDGIEIIVDNRPVLLPPWI